MTGRARHGLLVLIGASCAGTAVELAFNRHWTERTQLIAWVALPLVAAAAVALARAPGAGTVRAVRLAMAGVLGASLIGVVLHVHGNYEAGPLDAVYGERWDAMSATERWWAAVSQRVGPAPAIVPLVLAQLAVMVQLATLGLAERPTAVPPAERTPARSGSART